ncbi:MAG TPA: glycerophosphodiester phosphodiesterase [Terriglobales bacterium]|nr:glycerophosphodiester phosphodiesterase [Terriglobales bacterium]
MTRPLLLGHRGVRGRRYRVLENTIAAFDLALQYGCDGIEFDVRLTAEGGAVVCHNSKSAGMSIANSPTDSLRALPSLEEVLYRYASRAFLDIELKVPGLTSTLLSALAENPAQRGYVVSSFLSDVLLDFHAHNRAVSLGLICETRKELQLWAELPVQYVIAKQSLVTPKLIADIHSAGRKVFAWTVNDRNAMVRLAEHAIDGIISDRADLLASTLKNS